MTDKTMTLATELRRVCGHDSRSVDGCLHCEAADALEHRHLSQPAERGEAVACIDFTTIPPHIVWFRMPARAEKLDVYTAPPPAAGVPDELVRMTIRALDDVDTEMRATGRATNRFSQLASDWRGMLSATPSPTIDVAAVHGFHGFEIVENASVPEGEVWVYDKTKLRAIGDAK